MMTVIQSLGYEMEHSQSEDKMEMATSPYRNADDIEFDVETTHDPFVDNMLDDADHSNEDVDLMQADSEVIYQDDDMLDDDFIEENNDLTIVDLSMEAYDGDENQNQHDEVLLEEDARSTIMRDEVIDNTEPKATMPVDEKQTDSLDFAYEIQQEQKSEILEVNNTNNHISDSGIAPVETATTEYQLDNGQSPPSLDNAERPHLAYGANDENLELEEYEPTLDHDHDTEATGSTKPHEKSIEVLEEEDNQSPTNGQDQDRRNQKNNSGAHETVHDLEDALNSERAKIDNEPNGSTETTDTTGVTNEMPVTEPVVSLHPVIVTYLGQEMSLFPPVENDSTTTFFLADLSLAYKPFDNLLKACRDILGDSLEHDDELVLDIPALGLHVSEDSRYASQIGLAEVMDVYIVISRN
jgi:hypothetical protein